MRSRNEEAGERGQEREREGWWEKAREGGERERKRECPVALPLHRLGSPAWPIRAMMFATAPPPSNLNSPSRLAADYPNNNWSRFLNRPGVEHAAGECAIRR